MFQATSVYISIVKVPGDCGHGGGRVLAMFRAGRFAVVSNSDRWFRHASQSLNEKPAKTNYYIRTHQSRLGPRVWWNTQ